jgi:hypothetical protein
MAKKQFTASIASIVSQTAAIESRYGLRLSDVVQEPLNKLRSNPLNEQLFDREETAYFEQLCADVQERGILVPLIAKADGTLLAGHNRLKVVPVQYVEEQLNADAERKFVINDNLLRRQLSNEQRIKLYQVLYPNFDVRIRNAAGRPQKSTTKGHQKNNVDSVHISQNDETASLTAADIARDTGQSLTAVQKQLQRRKKEQKEKGNAGTKISKSVIQNFTQKKNDDTPDTKFIQGVEKQLEKAAGTNEATRKALMKVLKDFMKKLK